MQEVVQRDSNKSPQHIRAFQKTMRQAKHRTQPQENVIQDSTRVRAQQVKDGKLQEESSWQCRKSRKVWKGRNLLAWKWKALFPFSSSSGCHLWPSWIMFGKPWRDFPAVMIKCFKKSCRFDHIGFLYCSFRVLAFFSFIDLLQLLSFYFKFQFQSLTPNDHWNCEDITKTGIHLG